MLNELTERKSLWVDLNVIDGNQTEPRILRANQLETLLAYGRQPMVIDLAYKF